MKRFFHSAAVVMTLALALVAMSCSQAQAGTESAAEATPADTATKNDKMTVNTDTTSAKVRVETTLGSFTVLLYGDTPLHRDNFLKLVNEKYYDGTLFHRVIKEFMVQAGDPDSKNAKPGQRLGSGDPGYTLPAEIVFPKHFHKRGALAAARQGDQVNPDRRSSGSQFYVVTGKKVPEAMIPTLKASLQQSEMQAIFNGLAAQHMTQIRQMQAAGDAQGLETLRQELIKQTQEQAANLPSKFTPEMAQAYTELGGSPHLDGQYTVFGEVIEGLDVIDKIEKVATDAADRPTDDVRIISMTVLND